MSLRIPTAAIALAALAGAAQAQIAYISSASGYMLNASGSTAVTADWRGQPPIQGFGGYGNIQMGGRCLTGRTGGQPLTWEGCNGADKAQRWALGGGKLNNELGWCADVEGNRGGAGVRVLAWQCGGQVNQRWRSHRALTVQQAAAGIANPAARAAFERNAASAPPGSVISGATGQIVGAGAGNIVGAGAGNLVSIGGGNVVAAGAGN